MPDHQLTITLTFDYDKDAGLVTARNGKRIIHQWPTTEGPISQQGSELLVDHIGYRLATELIPRKDPTT